MLVTPQHLHRAVTSKLFDDGFIDYSFSIVRDPIDRLMSEYRWRLRSGVISRKLPPNMPKWKRKILRKIGKMNLDFDKWVRVTLEDYVDYPWIYDNHIRPQSEFIAGVDTLFPFENGLDIAMRWIDVVTETSRSPGEFWFKRSDGVAPTMQAKTRALAEAFYSKDFVLYEKARQRNFDTLL